MMDFAHTVTDSPLGKVHIFSIGQAGFIIKSSSGQLLAIDLYLSDCVERLEANSEYKRLLPQILKPTELIFDVIICTHPHFDHFDVDAIPEMIRNDKTTLFCSKNCKKLVDDLGFTYHNNQIIYVKPFESYDCGDFKVHFINCDHGQSAPDAVGVIVKVDEKIICEVGDTCLRLDRIDECNVFGKIDVLIAPINGAFGNLNEDECVNLCEALNPKIVIPCHYGMFAAHGGDVKLFCKNMKKKNPEQQICVMAQGDEMEL